MRTFGNYDFSDVEPIPLESPRTEGSTVCKILYSNEFKELMSYMKGLMIKNEISERALYLTYVIIHKVSAHYSIWQYRYHILQHLVEQKKKENNESVVQVLQEELRECSKMALNIQKNYQIWHYRHLIIELLIKYGYDGDARKYSLEKEEYPILSIMLTKDEKNYHVWSYKRWLVKRFNIYDSPAELTFTTNMLKNDVRNNSAWSFRLFLLFGYDKPSVDLKSEFDFVKKQIKRSPTNPSSWNYLRGLCDKSGTSLCKFKQFIRSFTENDENISIPAIELLAVTYIKENDWEKANGIYGLLADKLDPIRSNYWNFKKLNLKID